MFVMHDALYCTSFRSGDCNQSDNNKIYEVKEMFMMNIN